VAFLWLLGAFWIARKCILMRALFQTIMNQLYLLLQALRWRSETRPPKPKEESGIETMKFRRLLALSALTNRSSRENDRTIKGDRFGMLSLAQADHISFDSERRLHS
jgi:hypothetical protein